MLEQVQQHRREFEKGKSVQLFEDRGRQRQDERGHVVWRKVLILRRGTAAGRVGLLLAALPLSAAVSCVVHLLLFSGSLS